MPTLLWWSIRSNYVLSRFGNLHHLCTTRNYSKIERQIRMLKIPGKPVQCAADHSADLVG
jgi:hypothetical protein